MAESNPDMRPENDQNKQNSSTTETAGQGDAGKDGDKAPAKMNRYPIWSMRIWYGFRPLDFFQLLYRNRFQVRPARWGMAVMVALSSFFNTIMALLQKAIYGRRIQEASPTQAPVFIIGHWRTGTTFLHELMIRDPQMSFPSTYACFAPHHFLVTGKILPRLIGFLLPAKRPMDNMAAGFDRPQEDEFALCALGAPTPYLRMAFPNRETPYLEFLNMVDTDPDDLERFKSKLVDFVKALSVEDPRRLVLKSPPHTGRVKLLAELFPGARFIHLVRDPHAVFPSTVRTWRFLDETQGFQWPKHANLRELVFRQLELMYEGFWPQSAELPSNQIIDVRYEDLVAAPLETLEQIYRELGIDDFENAKPAFSEHLAAQKDYQANRHQLDDSDAAEIDSRWQEYAKRYGYDRD